MKKLVCSLLCSLALVAGMQAQSVADIAKVKFVGVKAMRIVQDRDQLKAYVRLQISNSTSSELVVADGSYKIWFESAVTPQDGKDPVFSPEVGPLPGHPLKGKEFIIPKTSLMSPGVGIVEVEVALGQAGEDDTDKAMINLFNLSAAEHQRIVRVILDGNLRFGVNVGKATVFKDEDIRWVLTPKAMDRVLFTE